MGASATTGAYEEAATRPTIMALGSSYATRVEVLSPEYLGLISGLIHDSFFAVSAIEYDATNRVLAVPFDRPVDRSCLDYAHRAASAVAACALIIYSVDSWVVDDTQSIDMYDFSHLSYEAAARLISVNTNIPMNFRVVVTDLHVELRMSQPADRSGPPHTDTTRRGIWERLFGSRPPSRTGPGR